MYRTIRSSAAASLASAAASGPVFPQVVADSACPKYAVDIAAFATCDGDRVAKEDAKQEPKRHVDTAAESRTEPVRQGGPKRLWRFENCEPGPLITVLLGAIYLVALLGRGCTSFT